MEKLEVSTSAATPAADSVLDGVNPALAATPASGAIASADEIPDKLYFRIGEVARLAGIKPYVLRFWETEFPALGPKKSGTGHRLFRRKDVELLLNIKHLLYDRKFTIEGARDYLKKGRKAEERLTAIQSLKQIRQFFLELKATL